MATNSNLTQNGLSIGAFNTSTPSGATTFSGSITTPGSRPADKIAQAQSLLQETGLLQYPLEGIKYYTQMRIYKYARNDLMSVALSTLMNSVILPYPDRMLDVNKVGYDQVKFGTVLGGIVNGMAPVFSGLANGTTTLSQAGSEIAGKATSTGTSALAEGTAATFAGMSGEFGQAALGAAGYAPNYFLTVVLTGPQYKTYDFTWTFAPRNASEMVKLTQILRVLKDASAPGITASNLLFTFPRVFQNCFMPNPGLLYQFKPSVLVACQVDYTGGGVVSMKRGDPATRGWNGPAAVRVSCSFMELEFWLRSDYGDVTPSANGVQDFSANTVGPPEGSGRNLS